MKTNKHQTLLLANQKESIRSQDIVTQFDYSPGTARSYLSYLGRHGLLTRTNRGYIMSERGKERLQFFETNGCDMFDCPLCEFKKAGYLTCPWCGFQKSKAKARIFLEQDFLIATRNLGVYCSLCQLQIMTEKQAQILGIRKED
ncbi:MAG: DeoR family transcriptional regulator [Nitrospiria bacterium]